MVSVSHRFEVQLEQGDVFDAQIKRLTRQLKAIPGFRHYRLIDNIINEHHYLLLTFWASKERANQGRQVVNSFKKN